MSQLSLDLLIALDNWSEEFGNGQPESDRILFEQAATLAAQVQAGEAAALARVESTIRAWLPHDPDSRPDLQNPDDLASWCVLACAILTENHVYWDQLGAELERAYLSFRAGLDPRD